jgi:hypothetical protein
MLNDAKVRYSTAEAAQRLGLSVEQLRTLVRRHIALDEEVPENATFQASDLVVLRVLASRMQNIPVQ